jgi:NAD(P)-dependent dehydrogenase (short-subunit alcohol dehydrogenase family)
VVSLVSRFIGCHGDRTDDAQSIDALAWLSPSGRLIDRDEVAATAVWLTSPGAQASNRQTIVLNGGGMQV